MQYQDTIPTPTDGPMATAPALPAYRLDLFWSRVDKQPDGCWIWRGGRRPSGHGYFSLPDGATIGAHRLAWLLLRGPFPGWMQVCHNCPGGDNPSCVNPAHMFIGTPTENREDYLAKNPDYPRRRPPMHNGQDSGPDNETVPGEWLSRPQAAKRLGVEIRTLDRYLRAGKYRKRYTEHQRVQVFIPAPTGPDSEQDTALVANETNILRDVMAAILADRDRQAERVEQQAEEIGRLRAQLAEATIPWWRLLWQRVSGQRP